MKCLWCGIREATQKHHCLFHRMKGHPELDDPRNLMDVCEPCHMSGEVNGFEARKMFWNYQVNLYGIANMMAFYDGVNLKYKERFW